MSKINFVPDDYAQCAESGRTNLIYLVLFLIVMAGLFGGFLSIKVRQRLSDAEEKVVDNKMVQAQQQLIQREQLEEKRKKVLETAMTTSQLLETVPRSVLLAALTNNLPRGVSFLRLDIVQKESEQAGNRPANKYQKIQQQKQQDGVTEVSQEKLLQTHIVIEGIAGSDLQVAAYIERLTNSNLLDSIALVESKQFKVTPASASAVSSSEEMTFRQFELTAVLKKQAVVSDEDIEQIVNTTDTLRI